VRRSQRKNRLIVFLVTAAIASLALYLLFKFEPQLRSVLEAQMGGLASQAETIVKVLQLVSLGILAYLLVRALNSFIFGLVFRLRSGFEAPTLMRNVFSIVVFTILCLSSVISSPWLISALSLPPRRFSA
jgi:hypothetical protein